MIVLAYGKKKYTLLTGYEEVTGSHLVQIAHVLSMQLDALETQLRLLQILLRKNMLTFGWMSADAKQRMLPYVDWVFEKNTCTEQKIRRYRHRPWQQWYYGAVAEFSNLTMDEFNCSEQAYQALVMEEDLHAINELVAVLYRPAVEKYDFKKDSAGDCRIAFNANEIAYYAKKVAQWPVGVKLAILQWYVANRQMLVETYDSVYSVSTEDEKRSDLFDLLRTISGSVHGTFEMIERMDVHKAHREIEAQIAEAKRLEANTPTT